MSIDRDTHLSISAFIFLFRLASYSTIRFAIGKEEEKKTFDYSIKVFYQVIILMFNTHTDIDEIEELVTVRMVKNKLSFAIEYQDKNHFSLVINAGVMTKIYTSLS